MRSTTSSGEGLSIADNENESSCDSNPYAYPYFHSNGTSSLVYDLVVKFGSRWNVVATNSDSIVGELKHLIKKIQFRCHAQPMESSWTDSCGDTALHRLCQITRFPSSSDVSMLSLASLLLDVAHALIKAYPGSATTACNNWRETPLHQFVAHCGFPNHFSEEESVLAVAPENPMLDLLKLLSRDKACTMQNCWGALPLHDACELSGWEMDTHQSRVNPLQTWMKEQHVLMVDWLLHQNPDAVNLMDHAKQTPLHRAFRSLKCSPVIVETLLSRSDDMRGAQSTLWKHYGSPHNRIVVSSKDPQGASQSLGILWDITVAVLLRNKGDHCRLVHAAVAMKDCPLCVVELAVQLHPEQLLEKDEDGCTPLILAINHGLEGVINVVLRGNPSAASIPNCQGRLPLLMAAATHYSWEPTIKSLFVAKPRAVSRQDPTTLLYPFAVAAVEETREEADQVSTIYALLRVDPCVLTFH